jgi:hypothetical protein
MAAVRPFRMFDALLLLLILVLAGAARTAYLVTYADKGRTGGPLLVQDPPRDLDALVTNLREHQSYASLAPFAQQEETTAHDSPGYAWLLAWLARYAGAENWERNVRWIQCGLGALTAGLYFLFALQAFGSRLVACLTGLFCTAYPFWIINTAQINDGVLATFLLAACIYLGMRGSRMQGPLSSLLYGLALAGLALVRAALLPFAFVGLAWFLLRSRHESRGWLCALVALLGFAGGLAPWTMRNYRAFGEPIPIVDSAYLHLWYGNNPKATGGPPSEEIESAAPADDLRAIQEQPRRYASLGPKVWEEVRQHPLPTLYRRLKALGYFFLGQRWFSASQMAQETGEGDLRDTELILQGTLFAILALALLGWRWTYGWRKESMPASLALIWIPLPYILGHAEELSGPRLPLDGVLLTYAAFTLACLVPLVGTDLREARKPRFDE